jgi:hypothetical protein
MSRIAIVPDELSPCRCSSRAAAHHGNGPSRVRPVPCNGSAGPNPQAKPNWHRRRPRQNPARNGVRRSDPPQHRPCCVAPNNHGRPLLRSFACEHPGGCVPRARSSDCCSSYPDAALNPARAQRDQVALVGCPGRLPHRNWVAHPSTRRTWRRRDDREHLPQSYSPPVTWLQHHRCSASPSRSASAEDASDRSALHRRVDWTLPL